MSFHNRSVSAHQFSMVPRADIPRASFNLEFTHKTTFDTDVLIPVLCEEVLPGDSFSVQMTAFARLATPIFPLMDNLHLDTFFFFVPNRLVWDNWVKFMGEQKNPGDSTSYTVPKLTLTGATAVQGSLFDYFGLPIGNGLGSGTLDVNALPLRGYNLIYNEWFRDQNLIDSLTVNTGDSGDLPAQYYVVRRAKRPDYFTSALPWPQKGESVPLPLGGTAPVVPTGDSVPLFAQGGVQRYMYGKAQDDYAYWSIDNGANSDGPAAWVDSKLVADLSAATASTINALRQGFQIQKLLERDARGGTRYTEIVRAHFGVMSPDARLQRPEYLGGSSSHLQLTPVAQTSATASAGTETPQGNLAAIGTVVGRGGFSQSFTEHGYVFGIVNVRSDVTYQRGLRRHWSRATRYDYYFPVFGMLGEQAILQKEIFATGVSADDNKVFGYQERWSEYRYSPSMVTGLFRSSASGTLDAWHLAQSFSAPPVLGKDFIEANSPMDRVLAVGAEAGGAQLIFDSVFKIRAARPMPLYSVPGLIDHF